MTLFQSKSPTRFQRRILGGFMTAYLCSLSFVALAYEGLVDKDAQLAGKEKALRVSCQYMKETDNHIGKVFIGFCQKMSKDKLCVRNQPIKTIVL